ncbi:hypothetical protein K7432_009057 [Basidiobolus ranarum]|uniref:Uncharacterized protein n=1 Tax=Basidiobolus ranarum TaxID=34480 RepID=A0ABR2VXT4_9FUNG
MNSFSQNSQNSSFVHDEPSHTRSFSYMLKPYMSEESLSDIALEGFRGSFSSSDFSQYKHDELEPEQNEQSSSNLDFFLMLTLGATLLL